jgi:hypothetical protein
VLAIASPYWYRATLTRLDGNFAASASPVDLPGTFLKLNPNYVLRNTATTDLGAGIIDRTLNFTSISGPVQLEEIAPGGRTIKNARQPSKSAG